MIHALVEWQETQVYQVLHPKERNAMLLDGAFTTLSFLSAGSNAIQCTPAPTEPDATNHSFFLNSKPQEKHQLRMPDMLRGHNITTLLETSSHKILAEYPSRFELFAFDSCLANLTVEYVRFL